MFIISLSWRDNSPLGQVLIIEAPTSHKRTHHSR